MKIYRYISIVCLSFIWSTTLLGQTTSSRTTYTINSEWQFYKGAVSSKDKIADSLWTTVSIPHTWNARDAFDDQPGYYRGEGTYRKQLFIEKAAQGKLLSLHFEGANQETEVFVNGKLAGSHKGGYTGFTIPITSLVKFGKNNELLIHVTNAFNENILTLTADFTFFGGIYRDVFLEKTTKVHFSDSKFGSKGVFLQTPKVSKKKASIVFKGNLKNGASKKRKVRVVQQLKDADKKVVQKIEKTYTLKPNEQVSFEQHIDRFKAPKLWSPEDPYLYEVVSTIEDASTHEKLDEVSNSLGFRWFRFDADKGFLLNGKPCKLMGTSRHQDYAKLGNAVPDDLQEEDVELLKKMGGNFLRIAHYPQDPVILEACDRLGIITTVEIPIVNRITESKAFADNSKHMMKEMIYQNYNHPSIVTWAYMNEILLRPKFKDDSARQHKYFKHIAGLAKELNGIAKKLDPYRETMIPDHGSFSSYTKTGLTDIPDIVGWNLYSGWYGGNIHGFERFLDNHHEKLDKPLIVTEYGAGADPRLRSFDPKRFDFSLEYQTYYNAHYLREILKRPFVAGANAWNLADFASATRQDAMPNINNKGLLTIDRKPKDAYYLYQAFLLKKPFLAIGSKLWNYRSGVEDAAGKEVSTQPIQVFTNLKEAHLLVNGKDLGTKAADENHTITWQVPFSEGENLLEVVAQANGRTIKDFHKLDFDLIPKNLRSKKQPFKSLRMSLGSQRYFLDALTHKVWLPQKEFSSNKADFGVEGGKPFVMKHSSRQPYGTDQAIRQTDNDPIYQTQQVGIKKVRLEVPDGKYWVTLHFAELVSEKAKKSLAYNLGDDENTKTQKEERVFDVLFNGKTVLDQLNIAKDYGTETAVSFKIKQEVSGQKGLTISFKAIKGKPVLNGLEIKRIY